MESYWVWTENDTSLLLHSFELEVTFPLGVSGGDVPAMSASEADGYICPCYVRGWRSCDVWFWSWRSYFPLLCQLETFLRYPYLKLTVIFSLVVSVGDVPAISVSEADGHIFPSCVSWWRSCTVRIGSWRSHLPLLCEVVTIRALSVSEADGHIFLCCIRWWHSSDVCIWSWRSHLPLLC